MENSIDTADVLPLTETTFYILLSLSGQARHGYAIMQDVESLSGGRLRFSTGTLYGALRRLLRDGWIERVDENEQPGLSDERNRKYYVLTDTGEQVLGDELHRLRSLVAVAEMRASEAGS
ncbi:MAG: PadR family transcriptional regulator [Anaerolineales bacterium]|jgi:DNA-binding PadR family transcriptional regulator